MSGMFDDYNLDDDDNEWDTPPAPSGWLVIVLIGGALVVGSVIALALWAKAHT